MAVSKGEPLPALIGGLDLGNALTKLEYVTVTPQRKVGVRRKSSILSSRVVRPINREAELFPPQEKEAQVRILGGNDDGDWWHVGARPPKYVDLAYAYQVDKVEWVLPFLLASLPPMNGEGIVISASYHSPDAIHSSGMSYEQVILSNLRVGQVIEYARRAYDPASRQYRETRHSVVIEKAFVRTEGMGAISRLLETSEEILNSIPDEKGRARFGLAVSRIRNGEPVILVDAGGDTLNTVALAADGALYSDFHSVAGGGSSWIARQISENSLLKAQYNCAYPTEKRPSIERIMLALGTQGHFLGSVSLSEYMFGSFAKRGGAVVDWGQFVLNNLGQLYGRSASQYACVLCVGGTFLQLEEGGLREDWRNALPNYFGDVPVLFMSDPTFANVSGLVDEQLISMEIANA